MMKLPNLEDGNVAHNVIRVGGTCRFYIAQVSRLITH